MGQIFKSSALAAALVVFVTAPVAQAVPISGLPDLNSITFWERTGGSGPVARNFAANSAALTTRLADPLGTSNNDFTGTSIEFYDVFYSDADDSLNANGAFVSIEAIFNGNDSALNIARVDLIFGSSSTESANSVASSVLGPLGLPATLANAVDGSLNTHTSSATRPRAARPGCA